ncbi:hypothetical protein RIdsm_00955 [Roseovarius indicus]|uniref:Uncharacterized protein n=1 Tax=Roseovarius indicus TaxID=540747 RepID=A0A0T5P3K8_9RHOB|nr:hypothetical protein XM52_22080 [Roseovarius indicus]QEW25170.1 hypothetical protein RIdsm_00955 [Roseovarius indicus]SFE17965.1 hypothetical protein SAMN04488031_10658 [Roseovarius indicus]
MAIKPGTTWARGPVVTHERVDEIRFRDGTKAGGKFVAVYTFRDGKSVDFIHFESQHDFLSGALTSFVRNGQLIGLRGAEQKMSAWSRRVHFSKVCSE